MRSVEKIISDWKATVAIWKQGRFSLYPVINWATRYDNMRDLIVTLQAEGYTAEDITSISTRNKVIAACVTPEDIKSKSRKEQMAFAKIDWENAIGDIYKEEISSAESVEKTVVETVVHETTAPQNKESETPKPFDVEPENMLKVDRTGFPEPIYDLEFMKEMGLLNEDGTPDERWTK